MRLYSLHTLAILLVALGLIIPTGATLVGTPQDAVSHGIVLTPHDGPNGQTYAEIGPDGNLSIDLATVGVNPNALTSVRNVFDVTNTGDEPLCVWITHNASETVLFWVPDHGSIQGGEANNVTLDPGEGRTVSLYIDTTDVHPSGEPLLRSFQVHVGPAGPTTPTPTPTTTTKPTPTAKRAVQTPTATPTPTPTATPTEQTPTGTPEQRVESVDVTFDTSVQGTVRVREVPVSAILDSETEQADQQPPRASIAHAHGGKPVVGNECECGNAQKLRSKGVDALVGVDEPLALSGSNSILGSVRSVDQQRRLVKAVEVDAPPGAEHQPATITMRVNEERFAGSDLTKPRIGHKTADGWQMLPTTIVGHENGQLVLQARTPGFSPFAVFATPDVHYTWRLNNQTVTAEELRAKFDTPGYHNVTLQVTDSLGRTSNATYRVLVNDQPSATIEVPGNRTAGRPLTLRANVTNEVGNVTVTWTFPDGSQQTGLVARHTFERGDQLVRVTVEDEYGASTTVEQTIAIGTLARTKLLLRRIATGLSPGLALGVVALLAFAGAIYLRRLLSRGGWRPSLRLPSVLPASGPFSLRRDPPQIVAFEGPRVDLSGRRFVIGHLRIEDPDGDLRTVEIVVTDGRGNEVAAKTVDLRGRSQYVAWDEVVLPKSRAYVRAADDYSVQIRAGDAREHWTDQRRSAVGTAGSTGV